MRRLEKYIKKAETWSTAIINEESLDDQRELNEQQALTSGDYVNWRKQQIRQFDSELAWNRLLQRIDGTKQPLIIRLFQAWQSIAAVIVVVILGVAGILLLGDMEKQEFNNQIMPGQSTAYLQIDNGQKIDLTQKDTLLLFKDTQAQLDVGTIVYDTEEKVSKNNEYHKINVPRNGEFFVQLADGTKVWVNAASSIGFYTEFSEHTRTVELDGEAYFEVAKDLDRPFIVRTSKMNVRVLGTHFNVKAYKDEHYTYTTLNEGKVQVEKGQIKATILPNQQLVFENSSGKMETKEVDASIYSAWTQGKFIFKDERLETILSVLSRWYDLDVFYTNRQLKEERFSIRVNRYEDIERLLHHLEVTGGVNFEINQRALTVK